MRIAVTGYVSAQAGSVASANALLLQGLLARDCEIVFFSKSSFVDPRPAIGAHPAFSFVDVDNRLADRTRAKLSYIPGLGFIAGLIDSSTYNRLLVKRMREHHAQKPFDLILWLGEYARGRVDQVPSISFAQGPPGTDARSILKRFAEVSRLAGTQRAWRWRILAQLRLSRLGLPPLALSDHIIVGSNQSRKVLHDVYGIPDQKIHSLPYPIDLDLFRPAPEPHTGFRCLWLGRIIPRKRLDLFLDGSAEAIRRGLDLRLTIVGGIGFVPGYEKLIKAFPFPDRLTWVPSLPREKVPKLIHLQDVLAQPSDEENFGSSVAEAQACGLPVIVGHTNGNADYLCTRDIHLADDRPETFAAALLAQRKDNDIRPSRQCAEQHFSLSLITNRLIELLKSFR